jgi:hypothetical protein
MVDESVPVLETIVGTQCAEGNKERTRQHEQMYDAFSHKQTNP